MDDITHFMMKWYHVDERDLQHEKELKNRIYQRERFNSFKYNLRQNIEGRSYENQSEFHHISCFDLDIYEYIGQGDFADVHRGKWISHDQDVAIKIIRVRHLSDDVKRSFIKEISNMYRTCIKYSRRMYGT